MPPKLSSNPTLQRAPETRTCGQHRDFSAADWRVQVTFHLRSTSFTRAAAECGYARLKLGI